MSKEYTSQNKLFPRCKQRMSCSILAISYAVILFPVSVLVVKVSVNKKKNQVRVSSVSTLNEPKRVTIKHEALTCMQALGEVAVCLFENHSLKFSGWSRSLTERFLLAAVVFWCWAGFYLLLVVWPGRGSRISQARSVSRQRGESVRCVWMHLRAERCICVMVSSSYGKVRQWVFVLGCAVSSAGAQWPSCSCLCMVVFTHVQCEPLLLTGRFISLCE